MSVRVPSDWLERADALADLLKVDGYRSDRASVWRAALALGLDALEKRHGGKPTKRK